MTAAITPLEALRRLYEVARKVDASESGEFDNALQGELAVVEAVLRVTAAPVSAIRSELTVWYGSMSESNGKSNFTATLMRKGATAFDTNQFTFARSEYPDRVRYDADCMRYLIGEIDTQPCILDYDADKHSGYAAPVVPVAAQPVVPEGWKLVPKEPTQEMLEASIQGSGDRVDTISLRRFERANKAMLAAAPSLEAQPAGEVVLDAARYRWLRDKANGPIDESVDRFDPMVFRCHPKHPLCWDGVSVGAELDEVVDCAMAQGDKHEHD